MTKMSDQRGMTLIELLVATAITALIVALIGSVIYQFISVTERGNAQLSALHDIQNAARWISHDGQMAESTDLIDGDPPVSSVRLDWTDEYGTSHFSTYSLSGTELQRNCDGSVITVARHISAAEFSITGDVLTAKLKSSPPGRWGVSEEETLKVCLRPMT